MPWWGWLIIGGVAGCVLFYLVLVGSFKDMRW
jgi:hypothetical protein